jgi:hypothetical protein
MSWNSPDEANRVIKMQAGDHLQLLYHMRLAQSTFAGDTPLFYNLYEFNLGDDEACRSDGMRYYLPFSLFFTLAASIGGPAAGWNFMWMMSLWISFVFTWILLRRYTDDKAWAFICSALAIIFPYRWFSLMGGSPSGLAMIWIPILYYGLDRVIAEKDPRGAVLAGAALYFPGWSDPHTMLFAVLSAPCWCIISYIHHHRDGWIPKKREVGRYILAFAPLALFIWPMLSYVNSTQEGISQTYLGDQGRSLAEVALNSPRLGDAFSVAYHGVGSQIYIGYATGALLLLSLLLIIYRLLFDFPRRAEEQKRKLIISFLLIMGVAAIVILSSGTNMPGGSLSWTRLCRILPPYAKIRQPAKIFIILPTILSLAFALSLPQLLALISRRKLAVRIVSIAIFAVLMFDYSRFVSPSVCVLDSEQGAYAAVVEDSESRGMKAHILALPLWPGNSHWSSLNQYYASLYNIRMVNGYRPTPRDSYLAAIEPFASFNGGQFGDEQLDSLLDMGVGHMLIHEDAFPEKVSPFAVSHTINSMLAHPRIEFLEKDASVWAFRILDSARGGEHPALPGDEFLFPSRIWQAESCGMDASLVRSSEDSSAGRYLELRKGVGERLEFPSYSFSWLSGLSYKVRLRGNAEFRAEIFAGGEMLKQVELSVGADDWTWIDVEIPSFADYASLSLGIELLSGGMNIDTALLATIGWDQKQVPDEIVIPAPAFFHAGYTDMETGEVVLEPERVMSAAVFYGPKLPLPAGEYTIELDYHTDAEEGEILGELRSRYPSGGFEDGMVIAGESAVFQFSQKHNLRFALDFVYSRAALMRIKRVVIKARK